MTRYSVATYTDGPATRYNVIDHNTQEWIRRFASETEAKEYAAKLEAKALAEKMTPAEKAVAFRQMHEVAELYEALKKREG
jgi:hypothetical protein